MKTADEIAEQFLAEIDRACADARPLTASEEAAFDRVLKLIKPHVEKAIEDFVARGILEPDAIAYPADDDFVCTCGYKFDEGRYCTCI